jgi:Flp pilus assembly protein TadG
MSRRGPELHSPVCLGEEPAGRRSRRAPRTPWRERTPRERGIAMVWMALTLILLVLFAGFAVDVSNWYLRASRIQRAADAGAHAGVVFLPADLGNATVRAKSQVGLNGYPEGGAANTAIAVTQEPNPNRLRVVVTTDVPTYFLGLIGLDSIRMTRQAVAEYVAPIAMGSPENKLGNDPARNQNSPQFWINIAGPNATKVSGDRYQAKVCPTSVAGCTGTANAGINNDDYAFDGYFFALKVKSVVAGQPLKVQVYDPAFTYVGDTCGSNMPTQAQANALQALPGNPYPDGASRFAPGLTPWCTGDQDIQGRTEKTTFIVRAPDNTPWTDSDNPVVSGCTVTMPAFDPGVGGLGTIQQMLTPTDPKYNAQFAQLFRQNVTICTIPAGSVQTGDYILQVRSNATAAQPTVYNSSVADGGHNRMSIFAGFGDTGLANVDGSAVAINARGRLPVYANADAANTTFYLARVMPYDAGRTLRVTLFDIGDAAQAGTLQILPPAEYATTFSGCSFARDDGTTMSTDPSTCTINNVSSGTGFNGRSVNVDIPIPTNYTCNDTVGTGCWIKVRAAFPAGVSDTTTWSAAILGNPIRLVQ